MAGTAAVPRRPDGSTPAQGGGFRTTRRAGPGRVRIPRPREKNGFFQKFVLPGGPESPRLGAALFKFITTIMSASRFLPNPPAPGQDLNIPPSGARAGLTSVTRRSFLKRTGGATVATLVAWNMASRKVEASETASTSGGSGWQTGPFIPADKRFFCSAPKAKRHGHWSYRADSKVESIAFEIFQKQENGNKTRKHQWYLWQTVATFEALHAQRDTEGKAASGYDLTCSIFHVTLKLRLYTAVEVVENNELKRVAGDLIETYDGPKGYIAAELELVRKKTGTGDYEYSIRHEGPATRALQGVENTKAVIGQEFRSPAGPSNPKQIIPYVASVDFKEITPDAKRILRARSGHTPNNYKVNIDSYIEPSNANISAPDNVTWLFEVEDGAPSPSLKCQLYTEALNLG